MEYYDNELGKIVFRTNPRARRLIVRKVANCILVTVPSTVTVSEGLKLIEPFRKRILSMKSPSGGCLDENCSLTTNTFQIKIFCTERANYYFSLKDGTLYVACPHHTDFAAENVQTALHRGIEKILHAEAWRKLPKRLQELATLYHLSFQQVRINGSRGRWGSCSRRKSINLSFFLMLLPDHLIDYVLLHELTHTLEMNHSSKFWQKLDQFTQNQAKKLRQELKSYKCDF
jgi:predicted metal-dependent hydrolase